MDKNAILNEIQKRHDDQNKATDLLKKVVTEAGGLIRLVPENGKTSAYAFQYSGDPDTILAVRITEEGRLYLLTQEGAIQWAEWQDDEEKYGEFYPENLGYYYPTAEELEIINEATDDWCAYANLISEEIAEWDTVCSILRAIADRI